MIEYILVFETQEGADKQLKRYDSDNKTAFDDFKKHRENLSDILKTQGYYFVAELGAYVDDNPGKYHFVSAPYPFTGFTAICDDMPSLVEKVKKTIKRHDDINIGTILYTVKNHEQENRELKENAEKSRKLAEDLPLNETVSGFLQALKEIESAEIRGLNERERQEFERLFYKE